MSKTEYAKQQKERPVVVISDTLLSRTATLLASFATECDAEGIVYWFGIEYDRTAVVTTLVVPDAKTQYGCISTSPEVNAEALSVIVGTPLVLIGQAHSHPSYKLRHSWIDDRDSFARFEGALSVVVPFFGKRGIRLSRCGVHRFLNGRFRVIGGAKMSEHLRVIPGEKDCRTVADPTKEAI